jgi:hypothetical protein
MSHVIFNREKVITCIEIINKFIYESYDENDVDTFAEFTPCSIEEIELLESITQDLFESPLVKIVSENVIYWSIIYYYYNTIVLEYNITPFVNQKKLYKYIDCQLYRLRKSVKTIEDIIYMQQISSVQFKYSEINKITNIMVQFAFSDEEWICMIRRKINKNIFRP